MRFLLVSLVAFAALGAHDEPALVSGMGTLGCAKLNEQLVPNQRYGQNKLSLAVFSWVQGKTSTTSVSLDPEDKDSTHYVPSLA